MPINKSQANGVTKIGIRYRKMSLNVSYNQNLNSGVDAATLREVTQQIFQRANTKSSALANVDLTKFNRPTVGMDLYSGKVDSSTARQVAMTNSGMQVSLSENALNSLRYLNSQASQSVFQNVDGKIAVNAKEEIAETKKGFQVPAFGRLTETTDLEQDKRGSNPFYRGELLATTKKEEEKEESLNIFA